MDISKVGIPKMSQKAEDAQTEYEFESQMENK